MALRPTTLALRLTEEQRGTLNSWIDDPSISRRQALRARIVLMAADGAGIQDISDELQCSAPTVRLWRQRFADAGLEGLEDLEGRGRPRTYQEELVEQVLKATQDPPPAGMSHWTTRAMAAKFGIGRSTVQRIWQEHGLQPHLQQTTPTKSAAPSVESDAIEEVAVEPDVVEVVEPAAVAEPYVEAEQIAYEQTAEPLYAETEPAEVEATPVEASSLLGAVHGLRAADTPVAADLPAEPAPPAETYDVQPERPAEIYEAAREPILEQPPVEQYVEPAAPVYEAPPIEAAAVILPPAVVEPEQPMVVEPVIEEPIQVAAQAEPEPVAAEAEAVPTGAVPELVGSSDPAAWESGRTIDGSPVTGVLMSQPHNRVKYEVAKAIGSGASGTVYLGYEPDRDRRVALKVLHERMLEPTFIERFKGDVPKLKQLNHPNCAAFFDFIDTGDQAYVISEYVDGASVRRVSEWTGVLSAEQALGVIKQTMKGLQAAHELGIVHHDLNPGNLIADLRGMVKITDFGQAIHATGPGAAGSIAEGTPAYMSPEQITGGTVDRRSDLYSAGVMLFELLSGRPPFVGKHHLDAMRMHLNDPVPDLRSINPQLSERLQPLVARAMAKDPAKRHQTAKQFLAELELVAVNAFGTGWEERSSIAELVHTTVDGKPVDKRVIAPVPIGLEDEMAPASGKDRERKAVGAVVPMPRDAGKQGRRDMPKRWQPEDEEETSGVGRLAVAAMLAAIVVGGGGIFAMSHGFFGGGSRNNAGVAARATAAPSTQGLNNGLFPSQAPAPSPSAETPTPSAEGTPEAPAPVNTFPAGFFSNNPRPSAPAAASPTPTHAPTPPPSPSPKPSCDPRGCGFVGSPNPSPTPASSP